MARKKIVISDPVESEVKQTRRAMVGLLSVGVAGATAAAAGSAAAAARNASAGRTAGALQKIIGNPELMSKLEMTRTPAERAAMLAQFGVDGSPSPQEIYQTLSSMIAKHARPGSKITPHVYGRNDWMAGGGTGEAGRPVEWVGAVAAAGAWAAAAA